MFIPLRAHVPMDIRPWANYAILLTTIACSVVGFADAHFALDMTGYRLAPVQIGGAEVDNEQFARLLRWLHPQRPQFEQTLPAPVAAQRQTAWN